MNLIALASGLFGFVEGIETLQIILFAVGLFLLIVEAFMPGFGIAGITGLVLLIIGIIMTARGPTDVLVMVIILLLLMGILLAITLRSAKKGLIAKRLILHSAARHEEGFSTSEDTSGLIGRTGITLTVLRPSGSAEFGEERMDVVSEGVYIGKGTKVRIIRTEGRRIVVEPDDIERS
jgi:membrane-bound ClpP family serine protease